MKIYDISQELFSCRVFPGDPAPERNIISSIDGGDICNVTEFSMCAHNGTHIDAPYHFINDGVTVDKIPLDRFVGYAYVTHRDGVIGVEEIEDILGAARSCGGEAAKRLLVGGEATLSEEAAEVLAEAGILLYGNESQTVGPENAPARTHLTLLGTEAVLLEGIRLEGVPDGVYLLCAAPLNLASADGSPCRAVLIGIE